MLIVVLECITLLCLRLGLFKQTFKLIEIICYIINKHEEEGMKEETS